MQLESQINTKNTEIDFFGLDESQKLNKSGIWRMVHSLPFEIIVIIVILSNSIMIVYEAIERFHFGEECNDLKLFALEAAFNVFYLFEFIMRILADKGKWFTKLFVYLCECECVLCLLSL